MNIPNISENWRETLFSLAEDACAYFQIQETTLGNKIVNDADFFPSLRKGSRCGVDQYIRVFNWFKENLPHSFSPLVSEMKEGSSSPKNIRQAKKSRQTLKTINKRRAL